jgi:hypothetical protein
MKRLPQLAPEAEGLGRPTIMDRALAQDHGVRYVHLAVFAIDVDRVAEAAPAEDSLPLGWEVFLTEHFLLAEFSEPSAAELALLEDVCEAVLDQEGQQRALGNQLCFAIYDAVARGALPNSLGSPFKHWRSAPKQLLAELAELWRDPEASARRCALHCLAQKLEPPLAPPTLEALQELAGVALSEPA